MFSSAGKVTVRKHKKNTRRHLDLDELILELRSCILNRDYDSAVYIARRLPRPIAWDTLIYNEYNYVYRYKRMIEDFLYQNYL